ncbi:hypothetical protein Tsubulata_030692 [Turnera subulata]|uniref:Uncharacterized protein n=1 Tax=Turnera subulata TaxID=218843 RepID=A0A9Q0FYU8_9ROSI|nr:hypothetical protein Tsubulata_030692 [Turnera subulata]
MSKLDVPAPPSNTAVGGKASLQPKCTSVTDREIEAIQVGINLFLLIFMYSLGFRIVWTIVTIGICDGGKLNLTFQTLRNVELFAAIIL